MTSCFLLLPVCVYPHDALRFLWTSLFCRQIIINVGDMPQYFVVDILVTNFSIVFCIKDSRLIVQYALA